MTARAATTSSIALGLILAAIGLATTGIQINVEFERPDSGWLLLAVPVTGLAVSALLSPLSFLLDKMLFRRRS
jgi:hypothetical protein